MTTLTAILSAQTLLEQFAEFINDYLDENGIQDFINDPEFATVLAIRFAESNEGGAYIRSAVEEISEQAMKHTTN